MKLLYKSHKGFTLIEMLIVVAIIGILAGAVLVGLGPAQKSSRDARRMSDLRQIQNALEIYYNRTQGYPAGDFAAMKTAISPSITSNVPDDPSSAASATYYYAGTATSYVLGAVLEDPSQSAKDSSHKTSGAPPSAAFPADCGAVSADPAGYVYCISL